MRAQAVDEPDPTVPMAGNPKLTVDKENISACVNEVRGDQSEGDGCTEIHSLHAATDSKIEEERHCSPGQCF